MGRRKRGPATKQGFIPLGTGSRVGATPPWWPQDGPRSHKKPGMDSDTGVADSGAPGAATDALSPVLASMTEAQFQWHVRTALEVRGWRVFVVPDMRRTAAGLPDILALHPRHPWLLALELKSATGRVKPKQREFRDMVVRVPGVVATVVRPADWPALRDTLDDLEARWHGAPAAEEV